MNQPIVILLFLLAFAHPGLQACAQESPAETAKTFIREGDYNNAILVLNRALETDKNNIALKKDLALAYYLQRNFTKGTEVIKPVVESREVDVQSIQILAMIYKAVDDKKEATKLYRNGLKKFPKSGALHNEYGEVLWSNEEFSNAARQWETGIENDPNFPGNYYNAAKFYYLSADKVRGLIYGEIFVNLESFSKRTPEVKNLLLEGYKKLFADTDIHRNQQTKNEFTAAFLDVMKSQSAIVSTGVSADVLSALRTRFLLQWFNKYAKKFPFRLFEHQQQLAKEGMFDAYNQWIFGAAGNLARFQQWTVNHSEAYIKFTALQKNRVFKMPEDQFYFKP